MFPSIEPPTTLVETVYNYIKSDIASSHLKPDEKINLKQLSSRYQVSETPIKQALNRLVSEGLIISVPRKGMRVRKLSLTEIEELFDIRLMLDTFFIQPVIETISSDAGLQGRMKDIIREHIRQVRQAATPLDYDTIYQLDNQFHELYIMAGRNQKAVEIYRRLNSHVYSTYIYLHQPADKTLEGAMEHQELLNAIIEKNPEKVREMVTLHIENARKSVCPILQELEANGM